MFLWKRWSGPKLNCMLIDSLKCEYYQGTKISLFKAHQNRQIQDRESEERKILMGNDIKKVDPHSNSLNSIEIENFDIYYGRFESVVSTGSGQSRRIVKSLKKYDVNLILSNKLSDNYEVIVNFIRVRGLKMKASEYIYILNFFWKNKDKYKKFLDEEMHLFADGMIKGLAKLSIYNSVEFVKLLRLVHTFQIQDENVEKNFLVKGNLLFANNEELENVAHDLFQVFKIFLSFQLKDFSSQGIMIQLKKKLLRGLPSIFLDDAVELLSLFANKMIFIDPTQIQRFDEIFTSNQELLSIHQFASIFDSMAQLNYQPTDLATFFIKYRFSKLKNILQSNSLLLSLGEDKDNQLQDINLNKPDINHLIDKTIIYIDQFVLLTRGFSKTPLFTKQEDIWIKLEDMLSEYMKEYGQEGKMNDIMTSNQAKIIICSFEQSQGGTQKIWSLMSNKGELDLDYEQNYMILKNLCRHNVYNIRQLNLALSYILEEESDLPRFELILSKEEAPKILEMIEVYALVIYKYMEREGEDDFKQQEIYFQRTCMRLLLKESVNALFKSPEKRWKNLSENEGIKLYGLLHLCEHKSQYEITDKIVPLERKIHKERQTYGVQQVVFLTLMQESFASEEQYAKWKNFIFKCIENSNQLEFTQYFAAFYRHGLGDAYLWSLLMVKYIELIELFHVQDLLSFMLVFLQKQDVEEEIWHLFLEVLTIKAMPIHIEQLKLFSQQIDNKIYFDNLKNIMDTLTTQQNNQPKEIIYEEFNLLESLQLPLSKIVQKENILSLHRASNIKYILNLI